MTAKIIRIMSRVDGVETEHDNRWVSYYDAAYHLPDGTYDGGHLETTNDPAEAMKFNNSAAAMYFWHTGPKCREHGTRADGKPNRPLTAFNVCIEDAPARKTARRETAAPKRLAAG